MSLTDLTLKHKILKLLDKKARIQKEYNRTKHLMSKETKKLYEEFLGIDHE